MRESLVVKIVTNNAVYVQKNDIVFLNVLGLSIPDSILLKVFKSNKGVIDCNRYEFIKFKDEEEMEFLGQLHWIIDYIDAESFTSDEIMMYGQRLAQERKIIMEDFDLMPEYLKKNNMDILRYCELLDFKMYSLRDILFFRQGYINMELPDYSLDRKIKKILKSMFDKNKK